MRPTILLALVSTLVLTQGVAAATPQRFYQRWGQRLSSLVKKTPPQVAEKQAPPLVEPAKLQVGRTSDYTKVVAKQDHARWKLGQADKRVTTITESWLERPVKGDQRISTPRSFGLSNGKADALWTVVAQLRARLETATPTMRRALLPLVGKIVEEMKGATVTERNQQSSFDGKTIRLRTEWDRGKPTKIAISELSNAAGSTVAEIELDTTSGRLALSDKRKEVQLTESVVSPTHARIEKVSTKSRDLAPSKFQKELDDAIGQTTVPAK